MFKITLRVARESCGYTVGEVAEYCGISVHTFNDLEIDSGQMQFPLMQKLINLYRVPLDLVYFGTEVDCIKRNRLL